MTKNNDQTTRGKPQKLAEALRDNLRRRKEPSGPVDNAMTRRGDPLKPRLLTPKDDASSSSGSD